MKASKLIEELKKLIVENGDVEINIAGYDCANDPELKDEFRIDYDKYEAVWVIRWDIET